MGTLAVANADFCSGGRNKSPDSTIVDILENVFEDDPESLLLQVGRYYAMQCTRWGRIDPFLSLRQNDQELVSSPYRCKSLHVFILTHITMIFSALGVPHSHARTIFFALSLFFFSIISN